MQQEIDDAIEAENREEALDLLEEQRELKPERDERNYNVRYAIEDNTLAKQAAEAINTVENSQTAPSAHVSDAHIVAGGLNNSMNVTAEIIQKDNPIGVFEAIVQTLASNDDRIPSPTVVDRLEVTLGGANQSTIKPHDYTTIVQTTSPEEFLDGQATRKE